MGQPGSYKESQRQRKEREKNKQYQQALGSPLLCVSQTAIPHSLAWLLALSIIIPTPYQSINQSILIILFFLCVFLSHVSHPVHTLTHPLTHSLTHMRTHIGYTSATQETEGQLETSSVASLYSLLSLSLSLSLFVPSRGPN